MYNVETTTGYIPAYRAFKLGEDDDGPVLQSLVADFEYPGPVARETRKPSEGRDASPNSGFYAVKDRDHRYPQQGPVIAEVDLFGEVVEGVYGYRAEGLIIRKLIVPYDSTLAEKLEDRYRCEVEKLDLGFVPESRIPNFRIQIRAYVSKKAKNNGHRPEHKGVNAVKCALCNSVFNWKITEDASLEIDSIASCTFDPKRSASSWLKYINNTPQSWEDCHTLFEVKQGGDPDSTRVGHETYVERRPRQDGPDAYAIRYHATDIITFEPNGAIFLKTNGWYTLNTKQRFRSYLPDGVHVWSDGKLNGKLRWYVSTPWSRAQSKGPGTYEMLVEGFRIGPRGEIKDQDGKPPAYMKASGGYRCHF